MVTIQRLTALVTKRVEIELEQVALNVDLKIKQAFVEEKGENLPVALKEDLSDILGPIVFRTKIIEAQLEYLDQEIETARLNVVNDFRQIQDLSVDSALETMVRLEAMEKGEDNELGGSSSSGD